MIKLCIQLGNGLWLSKMYNVKSNPFSFSSDCLILSLRNWSPFNTNPSNSTLNLMISKNNLKYMPICYFNWINCKLDEFEGKDSTVTKWLYNLFENWHPGNLLWPTNKSLVERRTQLNFQGGHCHVSIFRNRWKEIHPLSLVYISAHLS